MPLQEAERIELRDDYKGTLGDADAIAADQNRTEGLDEVAQYVVDEIIAKGKWPVQMTEIAEETGYSRQHCSNCISRYFRGANQTQDQEQTQPAEIRIAYVKNGTGIEKLEIEIPDRVDPDSYVEGYLAGKD